MGTAFLDRLEAYGIDPGLVRLVSTAIGEPFAFDKGEHLVREGHESDRIFFVDAGWLGALDATSDGGAFYRALYLPGDVAGLIELAWTPATTDLVALTPGRAHAVGRDAFDRMIRAEPDLGSVILTVGVVQQTVVADRHALALRSDGRQRLLYFLIELHARQSIVAPADWIELPMTQVQIANAVGISNVHVSVLMRALEEEGAIERTRGRVRLADPDALRGETGFRERWSNVDFSWARAFRRRGPSQAA